LEDQIDSTWQHLKWTRMTGMLNHHPQSTRRTASECSLS